MAKKKQATATRARRSASMTAYWASRRKDKTPKERAARDAATAYQRQWRANQSEESRARKAAYDKAWHERRKAK